MTLKRWAIPGFDFTALAGWTASASGINEYYYSGTAINRPKFVKVEGAVASEGIPGSLAVGEFGWGDNDSIGHDTVYVRLSTGASPGSTDVYYFITDTQTLLTAEATKETILLSLLISNYSTTDNTNITVEHTDGSGALFKWAIDMFSTDSPFALDSKIVLEPSDVIQVTSDSPDVAVLASGDVS